MAFLNEQCIEVRGHWPLVEMQFPMTEPGCGSRGGLVSSTWEQEAEDFGRGSGSVLAQDCTR